MPDDVQRKWFTVTIQVEVATAGREPVEQDADDLVQEAVDEYGVDDASEARAVKSGRVICDSTIQTYAQTGRL